MIYREKCAYHLRKNKKIIDKLRLIIKYKLNETSRKKLLHNEPSDVAGASQMKHPTTSQWNVAKTSQQYVFMVSYWYAVRTSQGDVMKMPHQQVSTTSQQVSNEIPNNVSGVRIHDVPLVRLYDVSCNSQMKHPITSLWYVSTTSRSYVVATPCLYYGFYYVLKLLYHDLQLVGFHVSFKHKIKHRIFLVPTRRETRGVVWIINQQNFCYIEKLLHKLVIFLAQIYKFLRKIIYSLKKNPNKKSAERKWRNFHYLISRIPVPPTQKQMFADVLQNSCF